jgi:hypothetical protein
MNVPVPTVAPTDLENLFECVCRAGNVIVAEMMYDPAFIRPPVLGQILRTMRNNAFYRAKFPKVLRFLREKIRIPGRPKQVIGTHEMGSQLKSGILRRWFPAQHKPPLENLLAFEWLARHRPEILAQKDDYYWAIIVQQWALNLYPYRREKPMKVPPFKHLRSLRRKPRIT